jgi:hypothetical protein
MPLVRLTTRIRNISEGDVNVKTHNFVLAPSLADFLKCDYPPTHTQLTLNGNNVEDDGTSSEVT